MKHLSIVGKGYHIDEKVVGFTTLAIGSSFGESAAPSRLDLHEGTKAAGPRDHLVHAGG